MRTRPGRLCNSPSYEAKIVKNFDFPLIACQTIVNLIVAWCFNLEIIIICGRCIINQKRRIMLLDLQQVLSQTLLRKTWWDVQLMGLSLYETISHFRGSSFSHLWYGNWNIRTYYVELSNRQRMCRVLRFYRIILNVMWYLKLLLNLKCD